MIETSLRLSSRRSEPRGKRAWRRVPYWPNIDNSERRSRYPLTPLGVAELATACPCGPVVGRIGGPNSRIRMVEFTGLTTSAGGAADFSGMGNEGRQATVDVFLPTSSARGQLGDRDSCTLISME